MQSINLLAKIIGADLAIHKTRQLTKTKGLIMNLLQNCDEQNLVELKLQLSDFGLYPSDWELIKSTSQQIKIQNKSEDSFYFHGLTEESAGKNIWKNISLVSW